MIGICSIILINALCIFDTDEASTPMTWKASPHFRAGQFTYSPILTSSATSYSETVTVTYPTALSAATNLKPALGIASMSYDVVLPDLKIIAEVLSAGSATSFLVQMQSIHNSLLLDFRYLGLDPSISYSFSLAYFYKPILSLVGPAQTNIFINFTYSTGQTFDLTHQIAIISFTHMINASSATGCFHASVNLQLTNESYYEVIISSSCAMNLHSVGYSRLIFDKTAIQNQGYTYFQYGIIQGFNSNIFPLKFTLNPYISSSFIMGMRQLKYTNITASLLLSFVSAISSSTSVSASQPFIRLGFSYWSLKYRVCPVGYPYFQMWTLQCFDTCVNGTYINGGLATCQKCDATCKQCSTFSVCSDCDPSLHRHLSLTQCVPDPGYYDNGSAEAAPCISNCLLCVNSLSCLGCGPEYYLGASSLCYSCRAQITNCSSCSYTGGSVQCSGCDNQFELVSNSCVGVVCADSNCILCNVSTTCLQCLPGYILYLGSCFMCASNEYFFAGTCNLCMFFIPGCISCGNSTDCQQCDTASNYFITTNTMGNSVCTLCYIPQCLTCASLVTCSLCNPLNGYFLNYTNFLCQNCAIQGCTTCLSLTQCSLCDSVHDYYLQGLQCIFCNSSSDIFYKSLSQTCHACSLLGCLDCSSLTQCVTCDSANNYYKVGSTCIFCNPSLNIFFNSTLQSCQTCSLFKCITCSSLSQCQVCDNPHSYFLNLTTSKCQLCAIEGCAECLTLETCKTCDAAQGYSLLDTGQCSKCTRCECYQIYDVDNSVAALTFQLSQCNRYQQVQSVVSGTVYTSYAGIILSLVTSHSVGIELFGVLQLISINLSSNEYTDLYLSSISKWSLVNGFNIQSNLLSRSASNTKSVSFLGNINIMLFVLTIFPLFILVSSKLLKGMKKLRKIIKQLFMFLFLFNCFNVAYSLGLHFKYYTPSMAQIYIFSTFCAVLAAIMYGTVFVWFTFADNLRFGEYTAAFKEDWVNQLYVPITIAYRFGLGLFLALNQYEYKTLIVLIFPLVFIIYNFINLPYVKFYHNYRANVCHISQLIVLVVANYYQTIQQNTSIEFKAKIHSPALLIIGSMIVCVLVSILCAVIQFYLLIRMKLKKKKHIKPKRNGKNAKDESKIDLFINQYMEKPSNLGLNED